MERDVLMGRGMRFGQRGWMAASAVLLGFLFLFAGAGCGKKEGEVLPNGPAGTSQAPDKVSAGAEPAALPAGARDHVVIVPRDPSRIIPPGVSLKPVRGRGRDVSAVRWFVNGSEAETGRKLSPSLFRKGDRIHAVVTLGAGKAETIVTTREVVAVNSLPAVSAVRVEPAEPASGGSIRAVVEAKDADEDPLNIGYQWYVDNVPLSGGFDNLSLKGVKRGAWVHVKAVPNDGVADGIWKESRRYRVVNGTPVVKSEMPKGLPPGRNFVYSIDAEDPDGDPLAYTLTKGPPGMTLNGSTVEWKVSDDYLGRPIEFMIEISDGQGGRTVQTISMTIQPPRKP